MAVLFPFKNIPSCLFIPNFARELLLAKAAPFGRIGKEDSIFFSRRRLSSKANFLMDEK